MKRQLLILFTLSVLICVPLQYASAGGGRGGHGGHGGHGVHKGRGVGGIRGIRGVGAHVGHGHGFGRDFGLGFGFIDGGYGCGWDIAEFYRELLKNVPYYALHPPVYYSEPVPRTYGWSPFAYPPGVMTPEIVGEGVPVTINNPFVPKSPSAPADEKSDRAASMSAPPEPLVIVNPFVTAKEAVATAEK